jgi:hypothetical protein
VTPFEGRRPRLRTSLLVAAGVVVVAVTLFRVPLATVFTLGVLLVCPLLMVGMHGGGHGADHAADEVRSDPPDRAGDAGSRVRLAPPSPHQDLGIGRSAKDQRREVQP